MVSAAPKLRLVYSTVGPYSIAQGANGAQQIVDAYNAGDGALALTATPSVTWLTASVGATHTCSKAAACLPVQIGFATSTLARGTYTGEVAVNDPNAVDAPQIITVTVQIGGGIPDRVDVYAAPNGATGRATMTSNDLADYVRSTESGGAWLAVSAAGQGSFRFGYTYTVSAKHQEGMAEGEYRGAVTFSNSPFAADNKTVPVVFHVTSQPIAEAAPVKFRAVQNSARQTLPLGVVNLGQGTLSVSGATPSTSSGGNWLTATATEVSADPTGLAPGVYLGRLSVATNAANGTLQVPVELRVLAQSAPVVTYRGAVNLGSWNADDEIGAGDIVAIYGEQLSDGVHTPSAVPLPTTLGTTRVLVNGQPAPLYYVSPGQVNVQFPFETQAGDAVIRVERNGQLGNLAGVKAAARAPHILTFFGVDHGIIQNFSQWNWFPMAPLNGVSTCRAHAGDVFVVWATGLGQGSPAVTTGAAAPLNPLSWITVPVKVRFGHHFSTASPRVDPLATVMTPTLVGTYQVNVMVPADSPKGDRVPFSLEVDGVASNVVYIAVE